VTEREGWIAWRGHRTWYRIVGAGEAGRDPLVCLHGGPGSSHNYFARLEALAAQGREVVVYDQLGCGRSDRTDDVEWSLQVFLDELDALRTQLGLDRIHLLGTSWGGMLALEHALSGRPLRSLVLSSTLASAEEWEVEVGRLKDDLPGDVVAVLDRHERAGTLDDPEYEEAMGVFESRHFYRGGDDPPELERMAAERAPEVYRAMWGANEWTVTGSLRGWDVRPRLQEIQVPTLVLRGAYDLSTESISRTLVDGIPNAREAVFAESSHTPVLEETDRYLEVVGGFLREVEATSRRPGRATADRARGPAR
jgi:proline-specific peptidase